MYKQLRHYYKIDTEEGIRFKCDQCEYIARTKGNVKNHKQSIHEGIIYNCDKCDHKTKTKIF